MKYQEFKDTLIKYIMVGWLDFLSDENCNCVIMDKNNQYVECIDSEAVHMTPHLEYAIKFYDENTAYTLCIELQERTHHWFCVSYDEG